MLNQNTHRLLVSISLTSICLGSLLGGCGDSNAAKGAKQGATVGAISGAVGGLVSGLIFGGDPVERAAQGAVYGGATGATAGAIHGGMQDKKVKKQKEDEWAKLREEIGADSFQGLTALAECRHVEALRYAALAQKADNPNYAVAGLWLEILTYADQRREAQARDLFPALVEKDWNIKSESQAETTMRDTLNKIMDLREDYGLPRVCS